MAIRSVPEGIAWQADHAEKAGAPGTARIIRGLLAAMETDTATGRRIADWHGAVVEDALPLRIAGGLHALRLNNADPALAALYPPHKVTDAELRDGVLAALKRHETFLLDWTRIAPQTNEVRRSAALIAGAHVAVSHFNMPVILSELGASGGLNLMWDHYALDLNARSFAPPVPALTPSPKWTG